MLGIRVMLAAIVLAVMPLVAGAQTVSSATSKGATETNVSYGKGGDLSGTEVAEDVSKWPAPPTIPPPSPGLLSSISYVVLTAVGGGFIRWTSYGRTQNDSGVPGDWMLRSDHLISAPANCKSNSLANCPLMPK